MLGYFLFLFGSVALCSVPVIKNTPIPVEESSLQFPSYLGADKRSPPQEGIPSATLSNSKNILREITSLLFSENDSNSAVASEAIIPKLQSRTVSDAFNQNRLSSPFPQQNQQPKIQASVFSPLQPIQLNLIQNPQKQILPPIEMNPFVPSHMQQNPKVNSEPKRVERRVSNSSIFLDKHKKSVPPLHQLTGVIILDSFSAPNRILQYINADLTKSSTYQNALNVIHHWKLFVFDTARLSMYLNDMNKHFVLRNQQLKELESFHQTSIDPLLLQRSIAARSSELVILMKASQICEMCMAFAQKLEASIETIKMKS